MPPKQRNKPTPRTKLRGWFHVGFAPLVFLAALTLVCLAPTIPLRFGCAVYLLCSLVLFGFSGLYNVYEWKESVLSVLRRIDHANIFLLIAGTYTPLTMTLLPWVGGFFSGLALLILIWSLCIIGLLMNVVWVYSIPRWISTSVYCLVGLSAVVFIPSMLEYGGVGALVPLIMIEVGGLLYIVGSLFYAVKRPGRNAKIFGFHELFHIFTVLAWICQCVGIYFAML